MDKADAVADIVSIERELTRVQSDIDVIESRMKRIENQTSLSTIDLTLEEENKRILGPLGFVIKWTLRGVGYLFVIRD